MRSATVVVSRAKKQSRSDGPACDDAADWTAGKLSSTQESAQISINSSIIRDRSFSGVHDRLGELDRPRVPACPPMTGHMRRRRWLATVQG